MNRPAPENRHAYRHFIDPHPLDGQRRLRPQHRRHYSYFDTVVNQYLIEQRALNIEASKVIGLVVETQCQYFASITFPDVVHAGLRVAKLGNSSVRYEIGLFRNEEQMRRPRVTSSTCT
jgi:acyl-CoA thioester hydrolase